MVLQPAVRARGAQRPSPLVACVASGAPGGQGQQQGPTPRYGEVEGKNYSIHNFIHLQAMDINLNEKQLKPVIS